MNKMEWFRNTLKEEKLKQSLTFEELVKVSERLGQENFSQLRIIKQDFDDLQNQIYGKHFKVILNLAINFV